jgi:hypothetical protein
MMDTRKVLLNAALGVALAGLVFTGCKKNDDTTVTDDGYSEQVTGTDASRFDASLDMVDDDINSIALHNSQFRGVHALWILRGGTPCNATIDSSMQDQGLLKVIYRGNDCTGLHSRTGVVTLQLPYSKQTHKVTPWSEVGSTLTVTFDNFMITRLSDNRSVTFYGTKMITNVTGGMVDEADDIAGIAYRTTGMLKVLFDNNTSRTWNMDRTRSISREARVTRVVITGNATVNNYSNVSVWGINRSENPFTVAINLPIVLNSQCDLNGMSGVKTIHQADRVLTVTYGVDKNGLPVTTGCPYGYRLNWVDKTGEHQVIISY